MKGLRGIAGWIALGAGAALAGPGTQDLPQWAGGLPAAEAEAKQRKAPLLVILNLDGERGNEGMLTDVYPAPTVREAMKKCVVTIASIAKHREAPDPRTGKPACTRFGTLLCAEHNATEEVIRKEWLRRGPQDDVESPRHIFRSPEGKLLFEQVWTVDADELVALIDRAVLACVPATLTAWDTTPARLARVADPLRCVRQSAIGALVLAHDAALDTQIFDLARTSELKGVAHDVIAAMTADTTPARAESVLKLLSAPAARARMEAAASIASLKGKDAFDLLCAAFAKEKNLDTKCVMLRAAAVAGGDPAKTREFVLKSAKAGDPQVRTHAVVALAPWAKEDAVVEAIHKIPAAEKLPENLRAAACWTLGFCGRKEIALEMKPWTEEKEGALKRAAKAAVFRIESKGEDPNYFYLRNWVAHIDVDLPEADAK